MLRAVLTAFAFALLVAGCPPGLPGVPAYSGGETTPSVPPEAGDVDPYYSEEMICEPPTAAAP
ncbi:MAG: hypothetical protein LBJ59_00055 [Zoogloeaceae bacterium]|nr:hypothetical protein [Zoogloeaceae bacterium]